MAAKLLLNYSIWSLFEHGRIDLLPFISEKCRLSTVNSWWVVQLEDGLRGIKLAHLDLSTVERHNFWWHYRWLDLLFREDGSIEEDVDEWVRALRLHSALELTVL